MPIPASAWEPLVLAPRVADYSPAMLDELTATGEVLVLRRRVAARQRRLAEPARGRDRRRSRSSRTEVFEPDTHCTPCLLEQLAGGGAYFFHQLREMGAGDRAGGHVPSDDELTAALWELFWAGRISNDTFAPVRALLAGGHTAHRQKPAPSRLRSRRARTDGWPGWRRPGCTARRPAAGRRALERAARDGAPTPPCARHALAELLLDRYGVVTRGSVVSEGIPGGFGLMYKVLARLEEDRQMPPRLLHRASGRGPVRRPATVDRLRTFSRGRRSQPARRRRPWLWPPPTRPTLTVRHWAGPCWKSGHRPGRKAGALVVLVDGALALYVERGGKTLLCFSDDGGTMDLAAARPGAGGAARRRRQAGHGKGQRRQTSWTPPWPRPCWPPGPTARREGCGSVPEVHDA